MLELDRYFVDKRLTEADKRVITAMFNRNAPTSFAIVREKIIEVPVERPVYVPVPKLVYTDHEPIRLAEDRLLRLSTKKPKLMDIADLVCEAHGISIEQLKRTSPSLWYAPGGKSSEKFVTARTHFILLAMKKFPFQYVDIAEFIGYKSHSDVSRIARGQYRGNVAKRFSKLVEVVDSI